jgi:hypothetical protein
MYAQQSVWVKKEEGEGTEEEGNEEEGEQQKCQPTIPPWQMQFLLPLQPPTCVSGFP